MTPFAQTNISLLRQMQKEGYSPADLETIQKAYFFAARSRVMYYRGSGKPFICHLVGVASILVAMRQPVDIVAAGLLHAMYLKGTDFGAKKSTDERRPVMQKTFGKEIENLVYNYHLIDWKYGDSKSLLANPADWDDFQRAAVAIRLANELEDFLDNAILFCGSPNDPAEKSKSLEWRLRYLDTMGDELTGAAHTLGHPQLAAWISEAISETKQAPRMDALMTGYPETFKITPLSMVEAAERKRRRAAREAAKLASAEATSEASESSEA